MQDLIRDCFVTGQWDKSEDAATRLQEDGQFAIDICYGSLTGKYCNNLLCPRNQRLCDIKSLVRLCLKLLHWS